MKFINERSEYSSYTNELYNIIIYSNNQCNHLSRKKAIAKKGTILLSTSSIFLYKPSVDGQMT